MTDTTETKVYPLQKIGGRKFVLAVFVVGMAFAYRALGYFDSATTLQMVSLAIGMFGAANVVQKLVTKATGG